MAASGFQPLCQIHEERIQRIEDSDVDIRAALAQGEVRFNMLSEKIDNLADTVRDGMTDISGKVEKLSRRVDNIAEAQKDQQRLEDGRSKRNKRFRTIVWGAVMTFVGAVVARFGDAMWTWFTR